MTEYHVVRHILLATGLAWVAFAGFVWTLLVSCKRRDEAERAALIKKRLADALETRPRLVMSKRVGQ